MITISLDQPAAQFRPGETISGTVSWNNLSAQTEGLETRLLWYTEGKGNQDLKVVDSLRSDNLQPNDSVKFEFVAPTRPFSFSGKLISLIWTIEVVLFPSQDGFREQLTLSNDGLEVELNNSYKDIARESFVRMGR